MCMFISAKLQIEVCLDNCQMLFQNDHLLLTVHCTMHCIALHCNGFVDGSKGFYAKPTGFVQLDVADLIFLPCQQHCVLGTEADLKLRILPILFSFLKLNIIFTD